MNGFHFDSFRVHKVVVARCPVPQALPGRIIKASSLSSNPLPKPSRSHSPPMSSNNAILSLSLPCIDPAFE